MLPILAAVAKLPILSGIIGFFTPSARLLGLYAILAVALTAGGSGLYLWFSKKEVLQENVQLKQQAGQLEAINGIHEATIDDLKVARERDDKVLVDLQKNVERLDKASVEQRKAITALERENAEVRKYLAQRIPPELACVLNRTCSAGDSGSKRVPGPERNAPAEVRPARGRDS